MIKRSTVLLVLHFLAACICAASSIHAATDPLRILFIGNSYTSVNNLPEIFKNIVTGERQPVPTIAAVTPGGLTLEKHSKLPATLGKIDAGNWDVVVIQGQSQEAAMAEQYPNMRQSFQTGAAELCKRINVKSPKARIVFYETWARHADYWQNPKADKSIGNDATDMQARIRKWYLHVAQAAQQQKVVVAPVGEAWQLNYKSANPVRLHSKDNSHPAFSGSYLAALVIYATIYQPMNLTLKYHGALNDAEAARLQMLAAQAVKSK